MAGSVSGSIEFPVVLEKPISIEERARTQTGPYNLTTAISEEFMNKILKGIQQIKISASGHYDVDFEIPILNEERKVRASLDINIKDAQFPQNGRINLLESGENGKLEIEDLDLVFPNTKIKFAVDIPTIDKIKLRLVPKVFKIPLRKIFGLDDLLQISVSIPTNYEGFKTYMEEKIKEKAGVLGWVWGLLPQEVKEAINWIRAASGIDVVIKYISHFVDWLDQPGVINFSSIDNSISEIENYFQKSYTHNARGLEMMFGDLGLDLKNPPQNLPDLKTQLNIPNLDDKLDYLSPSEIPEIPLPVNLFSSDPDLSFSLEIPKFTMLELTLTCIRFGIKYGKGNNQDIPNRWRFYIYPTLPFLPILFDLFDILIEHVNTIENAIKNFLASGKQAILQQKDAAVEYVKQYVFGQIFEKLNQPLLDVLKKALEDFLDNFSELIDWFVSVVTDLLTEAINQLSKLIIEILGNIQDYAKKISRYIVDKDHLGFFKIIDSWIEKALEEFPVLELPDPFTIDPKPPITHPLVPDAKIAPKIPIEYLDVKIKSKELLLLIDIGEHRELP